MKGCTYMETKELMKLSELFKCFSDSTRLRMLELLLKESLSVGDIASQLDISQSLVSHQLKYLKDLHFVKSDSVGKKHIYAIADDHIKIILEYGLEHIREEDLYEKI